MSPIWTARAGDVVTAILGGGAGSRLDPLTRLRSKPAVPLAGTYRLIDIPISNAIHSGMERMLVLTQYNSTSLHRHIASTYNFGLFSRGFVQILAARQTREGARWFQGTADAVRQNLQHLLSARGDLVLVLAGDHIYRMDYRHMLRDLEESGADLVVGAIPTTAAEIGGFGSLRVDGTGRIVEFREKPADPRAREGMEASRELLERQGVGPGRPYLASMGIYLFRKDALRQCLDNELHDFGHHVIPKAVRERKVQAHLFTGYWRDIGTIRAFYEAHMDLVRPDPAFDLNDPEWPFYTHPRYLPGARLTGTRFNRSILSEGTIVEDSTIEDSILGVRTVVRGATFRRSVIMGADPYSPEAPPGSPPIGVGEGSLIQDAIVDKNARLGRNVRIVNKERVQQAEGPCWVVRDGIVIIPKNAVVPDGTVV